VKRGGGKGVRNAAPSASPRHLGGKFCGNQGKNVHQGRTSAPEKRDRWRRRGEKMMRYRLCRSFEEVQARKMMRKTGLATVHGQVRQTTGRLRLSETVAPFRAEDASRRFKFAEREDKKKRKQDRQSKRDHAFELGRLLRHEPLTGRQAAENARREKNSIGVLLTCRGVSGVGGRRASQRSSARKKKKWPIG